MLNSNEYLSLRYPYFYQEFSKKVIGFKFQNHDYLKEIAAKYKFKKVLADKRSEKGNNDFLLSFECEEIAIAVGGDFINFFNDFEALDDDEIKRVVSNTWMMYYLDYWNKKGTDKEYDEDPRCEEFPLE